MDQSCRPGPPTGRGLGTGATLVIRGGALGDFVLTFPVLAALRRAFPERRLDVLANARFAPLAVAGKLAEVVYHLDSPLIAGLFAPSPPAATLHAPTLHGSNNSTGVSEYFGGFDLIVSYLYDPQKTFETNVRRRSQARFIAGPHRPEDSSISHAADVLLKPLETPGIGISGADGIPRLELLGRPAHSLSPGTWLAAHPGSGSERKNWPEAKWRELSEWIIERTPWNLLLIGGEAEGQRVARMAARLPAERVRMAQDWPLVELARSMRECAAFVGHDSGITHLAAALGLPGLVLWGDTAETVWRPRGDKMNLLRDAAGLKQLDAAAVFAKLQSLLNV